MRVTPLPRWLESVEQRAYVRLRQLRRRDLWNGQPPIPVEHIIEHLLDLHIVWEEVEEDVDEVILACLRPSRREVVLNERRRRELENTPGLEPFSLGHEGGHADIFALTEQPLSLSLDGASGYAPVRRSATRGEVIAIPGKYAELRAAADAERARWAAGQDSPRVRRAVDHYAATLLMPQDLIRDTCRGRNLGSWTELYQIAGIFNVSATALKIRLQELNLIFGVDPTTRRILLTNPAISDQGDLFG